MAERPFRTLLRRRLRALAPRSVRARATFAATAVVTLALGGTALALLAVLHANLLRNAEDSAAQQASKVVELAGREHLPPILAAHGASSIRVVDSDGRVVAATPDQLPRPILGPVPEPPYPGDPEEAEAYARKRLLIDPELGPYSVKRPYGEGKLIAGVLAGDPGQQVVTMSVTGPDGKLTVYAGTSLREVEAAGRTTAAALAVGLPLLVLLVAVVTWRVTGRALRPVEAIRSEVAEITGHDLHRRVPVPRTGDEVSRLAVTVNATLDRLEDAGLRQRRFIADASHELRSPIAVLRTQLEVALAHPDPELWPDLLADALQDTVRLQDLAADLLLLARLDAADPVATELLDLDVLFADVLAARTGDRIPVRAELAPGAQVLGNRTWLTRLLTNLVDNAQRYADRTVRVRLTGHPGEVVLEVSDDGPGIPEPDRERVFERFTRLDDARSRELGGAGLGLAIARDLAEHHRGTLTAEPAPQGARLVARLPQAGPPSPADRR
ncbi:cell wall metabolism sensor histidine kinase WalK [Streptomyces sp. TLI_171]|uniref:sensor histidine kinase n=1 Tax=Streptomyces sp. TLI_171 TaxID=1938859 RepID=UPI000C67C660|nr:HAMP domain-containing sensor histidine kinase [Streptomyces sp. TLI_171]RKE20140.1 signal transduction histidine kinase [Streptomyces sp. TLI_171]